MPKQGMSSVDKTSSASSNGDTSAKNCSSWNRNISYDFKIYDGKFLFFKIQFWTETFVPGSVMEDTGQETVPVGENSLLIQYQPGHKPGHLQHVDTAQRYGRAHAERLEPRHFLETFNSTFLSEISFGYRHSPDTESKNIREGGDCHTEIFNIYCFVFFISVMSHLTPAWRKVCPIFSPMVVDVLEVLASLRTL